MFKKVSPNCHLSSVGVLELSKVQRVSSEGNGTCLVRDDASHFIKDFPPVEHFSLENQLAAGVPLKEVNSVVLTSCVRLKKALFSFLPILILSNLTIAVKFIR